jgi:large repetitive protein
MTTPTQRLKYIPLVALSAAIALVPSAAQAAIDNTAQATGTYAAAPVNSNNSPVAVPVTPAGASLQITKSVSSAPTILNGVNNAKTDAGDTITFGYVITNNGNITMNNVVPVDPSPQFNGVNGTGSFPAFTPVSLVPGASAAFSGLYTLSATDVIRAADITNGVTNTATASGTPAGGPAYPGSPVSNVAQTTINGFGALSIVKTFVLADAGGGGAGTADVGETITYTYTIANTGTAAVTNVQITDTHELVGVALGAGGITSETLTVPGPLGAGASTNTTANNGIWNSLAAGATITMTYVHVVTATEFNNQ